MNPNNSNNKEGEPLSAIHEAHEREIINLLRAVVDKVDNVARSMDKMRLEDFLELLNQPRKLLVMNFMMGLARGFGMAMGFTILAAVVLWGLQRLAILNVPVIGDFIAEIVRWVQVSLQAGGTRIPGGM